MKLTRGVCQPIQIAVMAALLLLCFSLSNAGAQTQPSTQTPVVIGMTPDYPPFSSISESGALGGIFVDLWRIWSEKTGRPIRFQIGAFHELYRGVEDGSIDVLPGMFLTSERQQRFEFTQPLYEDEQRLFYASALVEGMLTENLAGLRIGALRGTYQADFVARQYPEAELVEYDLSRDLLLATANGEIAGFVESAVHTDVLRTILGLQGDDGLVGSEVAETLSGRLRDALLEPPVDGETRELVELDAHGKFHLVRAWPCQLMACRMAG